MAKEKNKKDTEDRLGVGKKVRQLRAAHDISLQRLAEETSMSYSYLSGLENGRHSITLTNLQRLAAYFEVDLVYFLQQQTKPVRLFDVASTDGLITEDGLRFDLITRKEYQHLQVTVVTIPYPDESERHVHKHLPGNELIYVIQGGIKIMVESEIYTVSEGQGVLFASDAEHVIYGDGQAATLLLVSAPPYNRGDNK